MKEMEPRPCARFPPAVIKCKVLWHLRSDEKRPSSLKVRRVQGGTLTFKFYHSWSELSSIIHVISPGVPLVANITWFLTILNLFNTRLWVRKSATSKFGSHGRNGLNFFLSRGALETTSDGFFAREGARRSWNCGNAGIVQYVELWPCHSSD